jgi:hypothetical protein
MEMRGGLLHVPQGEDGGRSLEKGDCPTGYIDSVTTAVLGENEYHRLSESIDEMESPH